MEGGEVRVALFIANFRIAKRFCLARDFYYMLIRSGCEDGFIWVRRCLFILCSLLST